MITAYHALLTKTVRFIPFLMSLTREKVFATREKASLRLSLTR
jgi:hypothetical protein